MFDFWKRSPPAPPQATPEHGRTVPPPAPPSELLIQSELVRAALTQTLRIHGVPAQGLHSEILRLPGPDGQVQLHIRLVMTDWNDTLLKYAMALERELRRTLARYEPGFSHDRDVVSWQFAPECPCPFPELPAPQVWQARPAPAPAPEKETIDLFDRRHEPRGPNTSAANRRSHDDFEATRMAPP